MLSARKAALKHGQLPHEYLFALALEEDLSPGQRIAALKAAAPYYAPRLSSIEAKVDPWSGLDDEALAARIARLQASLQGSADESESDKPDEPDRPGDPGKKA